jgi:hypothetical protein
MKMILAATLMSLGLTAHAEGADQIYTAIKCGPATVVPDLGLSLEVKEGGFAGLTQVQVKRFFLGHTSQTNYDVQQSPVKQGLLGAPIEFTGNGIRLTINFTTAPDANGQHHGTLETLEENGKYQSEELSCAELK